MDSFLLNFVTSPLKLILLTSFLFICFRFYITRIKNFDDITWKRVDYLWVGLATIGIIGSSGNIERYIAQSLLANQEAPRLAIMYQDMYKFLQDRNSPDDWHCREWVWVKTEHSLPIEEFEKIKLQVEKECEYLKVLALKIPSKVEGEYPTFEELELPNNLDRYVKEKYISDTYKWHFKKYSDQYKIYTELKSKSDRSDLDLLILVLSPLLFCFGVAIRLTKVTGDILNSQKK